MLKPSLSHVSGKPPRLTLQSLTKTTIPTLYCGLLNLKKNAHLYRHIRSLRRWMLDFVVQVNFSFVTVLGRDKCGRIDGSESHIMIRYLKLINGITY